MLRTSVDRRGRREIEYASRGAISGFGRERRRRSVSLRCRRLNRRWHWLRDFSDRGLNRRRWQRCGRFGNWGLNRRRWQWCGRFGCRGLNRRWHWLELCTGVDMFTVMKFTDWQVLFTVVDGVERPCANVRIGWRQVLGDRCHSWRLRRRWLVDGDAWERWHRLFDFVHRRDGRIG